MRKWFIIPVLAVYFTYMHCPFAMLFCINFCAVFSSFFMYRKMSKKVQLKLM